MPQRPGLLRYHIYGFLPGRRLALDFSQGVAA
jgi:hypothetical protein